VHDKVGLVNVSNEIVISEGEVFNHEKQKQLRIKHIYSYLSPCRIPQY